MQQTPSRLVVMGVSGCGKSTLGRLLAARLGVRFVEGDEFHSPANVAKMAAGQALTDNDRAEWLHALSAILAESRDQHQGVVVACSALKKAYRNILRQGAADALFVHLQGSESVLMQRMQQRPTHYMPPSLLQSQLAILESPEADEASLTLDVMTLPEQQCQQVISHLQTLSPHAVAHH
jgi:carbohydrate kinase (thermoresistant glucokinase family)